MKLIVTTDGLNLRSTGQQLPNNIISSLPLSQEVEVINAPDGERFWEVETTINGQTRRGFASSRFLRPPLSQAKEKLLAGAVKEWIRFNRGTGRENIAPFFRIVGEYWSALGINLDGRDRDQPWSAAFISFIIRNTNAYPDFKFNAAHAKYILDAKAKRTENNTNAPFWLFRLTEHKPQLGDLVCKWRERRRTFDDIPSGGFKSHTDVIVEIQDQRVKAIGGNIGHSTTLSSFSLNANGFLKEQNNVFAIMRNNR